MRQAAKVIFLFLLAITFSCEEAGRLIYCNDCLPEEPLNTTLEIKLSRDLITGSIEVSIYEGDIEDDVLIAWFDYARDRFTVAVNKKYTILVKYQVGETYICINSTTPRVNYYPDLCEEPCWYVSGRVVDLRLKYR